MFPRINITCRFRVHKSDEVFGAESRKIICHSNGELNYVGRFGVDVSRLFHSLTRSSYVKRASSLIFDIFSSLYLTRCFKSFISLARNIYYSKTTNSLCENSAIVFVTMLDRSVLHVSGMLCEALC